MKNRLLAESLALDPADRIQLAQDLWESVSEIPAPEALTEIQKEELDRRLEEMKNRSDQSVPWREVLEEIRGIK